jgi:hypothetical protein
MKIIMKKEKLEGTPWLAGEMPRRASSSASRAALVRPWLVVAGSA